MYKKSGAHHRPYDHFRLAHTSSRVVDPSNPLDMCDHDNTNSGTMDITKFVSEFRESAFLLSDYNTYHTKVSNRLRILQKKLGRATPKNAKYAAKAQITAEDVAKDIEYVGIQNGILPAT
jgi:hypothetical protein